MESYLNKMGQGRGGIGAKSKRQNAQAQAKKHAQAKQKNEPPLPIQPCNESIFREIFGPHTIIRDWSVVLGIIGEVLDQLEDYCWAIVFARLMQATYNQGLPTPQQHEFSFLELVDHIKPRENESSALANLKIAIDHIASHGIMKKPIKIGDERASSKGLRIKKTFDLCEDVDASFIREKLDKCPVGLNLMPTLKFGYIGEEVYHLPKKVAISPTDSLHCILLIGYGMTTQGELYFIGQNSWGTDWGCRGYVRIIINELCDIICLKE